MSEEAQGAAHVSPHEKFLSNVPSRLSPGAMQRHVIASDKLALEETFARFERTGELDRAVALILETRRRFVSGQGLSASYASLLNAELSMILSNVFLANERGLSPQVILTDVRSTDVLICFLLRRYRKDTVELGRLFQAAGGKLVVVTDSDDSPLSKLASATVVVQTRASSYTDSPTAIAATCHLLAALIAVSSKGAKRRLATRDRVARDLELYASDDKQGDEFGREGGEASS